MPPVMLHDNMRAFHTAISFQDDCRAIAAALLR
jgi:hypothetical protein